MNMNTADLMNINMIIIGSEHKGLKRLSASLLLMDTSSVTSLMAVDIGLLMKETHHHNTQPFTAVASKVRKPFHALKWKLPLKKCLQIALT